MTPFNSLSIRGKVTLIAILVSTATMVVSFGLFLVYDLTNFREELRCDLLTQAKIIGGASTAAVTFGDPIAATETLTALAAKKEIVAAAIYTADGRLFAQFIPEGSQEVFPASKPGREGSAFLDGRLEVVQDIRLNGGGVGTICLRSDLRRWSQRLTKYVSFAATLLVVASMLALILAAKLQSVISKPIRRLRDGMAAVSARKDYSVRVERMSRDDIGALADGFNKMIEEIASRDGELLRVNHELHNLNETLEARAAERSAAAEERARLLAQSEDALRRQTQTLESILNSMGDGVLVLGDNDRIILFNEAARTVLKVDVGEGSTLADVRRQRLYLPDMVTPYPHARLPISRALRGEAVDGAEIYLRGDTPDEGVWLNVNARQLRHDGSSTPGAVSVIRDVTEQKRIEAALVQARDAADAANHAKSAFLANMSHELRTPLNAIIGYSEMLEEEAQAKGHKEYLSDLLKVHTAGKHLLALINDVLDLSKIEAGKVEMTVESFAVAPLVHDLVTAVSTLAKRNGNTLEVSAPVTLGAMRSDPTRIRQILINLLSNAAKFTSEGTIQLEVTRSERAGRDWVTFRVSDTGIGMSADALQRLFQDFTQADASTTRRYGGTGLGLAISRRFSQMLEGEITVESTEGEGSTFTLEIPAELSAAPAVSQPGAARDRIPPAMPDAPSGPGVVLVIDDDPVARELIARHLRKAGLTPVMAASGPAGLSMARHLRPSAITLDVLMPGMDGWAVLAAFKADPSLADIPVIMMTIMNDQRTGYALGASAFIEKPVDGARLAAVLQAHARSAANDDVLIVEDDPDSRSLLERHVVAAGCRVRTAENGRIGLDLVRDRRPGMVLLDLMMPEVDGFQFCDELRSIPDAASIPIVVISARELDAADRARLNGQVVRILQKRGTACDALLSDVVRLVRKADQRLLQPGLEPCIPS